jgi:ribonucleotide monophosphatase NagD (HAD superfamily)
MPEVIISDIDGTLIDDAGLLIEPVEDFIEAYQSPLILLTNRAESTRDATVAELAALEIEYSRLIMNGGSQDAPEFKRNEVKALLDQGYDVQAFIDNREDTRNAVAELGVQVINPAEIINTAANDEDMNKETPEALNAKLTADLSALTSERDSFMVKVTAADAELTAAKELAANLLAERDALTLKVSELEAAQATASKQAADLIAKAGAPIAPLNVTPAEQTAKPTGKELLEQLASMSAGKARDEFFIKHKSELFAARKRQG